MTLHKPPGPVASTVVRLCILLWAFSGPVAGICAILVLADGRQWAKDVGIVALIALAMPFVIASLEWVLTGNSTRFRGMIRALKD